jgi:carbon monoxide dehydrogenase subunit G
MEFGGRYLFSAPRDAVWAALNDTEKLQAAIPGARRLVWTGATTLELEIKVSLGIVSPTFTGDLTLSDIVPAETYTFSGKGRGLLGKAEGSAKVSLSDAPGGTELRFTATGGADNKIMSLGKALIGKSAQKVIDHFFETFGGAVAAIPANCCSFHLYGNESSRKQ